jgi:hypothetical protein
LFLPYSETRKNDFLAELKDFKNDAEKAIAGKNPHESCTRWQRHFGERFSCANAKDEDEDADKKRISGSIRNNSQYA